MPSSTKPGLTRNSRIHTTDTHTDPGLLRVYASWAQELCSQYQRISDLFRHAPSIGRSRELYLAAVLQRVLPSHLVIRHGAFYIPGHGASSEQDLLIIDTRKYPPIEEIGDFGVYFHNSVVACIEVKSKLTRQELRSALNSMITTKMVCSDPRSRYAIFAYETSLSPKSLLDSIENSIEFFDNRIYPIIVLGKYVVTLTSLQPKKPRPSFELTVFQPKSLDLTLLELIESLFEVTGESPLTKIAPEIREHFDAVASRTFFCPEERFGTGLGTNIDS
ncbi:DUF6602 domain-containing protein [Nitrosomonas oligotropha]|uniref:DUF6602 domain-containing protein n=1 Tax=Nitrosomonas oligotropha TaxID=42354 RepID=UPI003B834B2E|nr:hypothetical protein [Nitrosomonas oligotropha]